MLGDLFAKAIWSALIGLVKKILSTDEIGGFLLSAHKGVLAQALIIL